MERGIERTATFVAGVLLGIVALGCGSGSGSGVTGSDGGGSDGGVGGGNGKGGSGGSSTGAGGSSTDAGGSGTGAGGSSSDVDGGAGTCAVTPCGGSVVGAWSYTETCGRLPDPSSTSSCPTETFDLSGYHPSETLTFGSDSSYTANAVLSGTLRFFVPQECMVPPQLDCTQRNLILQQVVQQPGSPVTSGACETSGGGCQCTEEYTATRPQSESGTYATSGTNLTLTPTGSVPSQNGYCVVGNKLYVSDSVMGSVVFVKQ